MQIGELVIRAGVSRDTVRFYERIELLDEAWRPNLNNNYKDYSEVALHRIGLIGQAQALGFSLKEIGGDYFWLGVGKG